MNSGVIVLNSQEKYSLHLRAENSDLCRPVAGSGAWLVPMVWALLGCSSPRRNLHFFPLQKALHFSTSVRVRMSGIYTLLGDLVLLQCWCLLWKDLLGQKKKKCYLLTSLHEANWKFYFCASSEFSYLNVHYFLFKHADFISWPKSQNAVLIYMLR